MSQNSDYRVLRTRPEIEAFLSRIADFTEAKAALAWLEMGAPLDRIGSYDDLVDRAGKASAIDEVLTEMARDAFAHGESLPHLVLFPTGEMAVTRYLGAADENDVAQVRVAICPAEPRHGETMRNALAQILLGLQDSVGDTSGRAPLPPRREAEWPAALATLFDRDSVEEAHGKLVADRKDGDAPPRLRGRSDVINESLIWYASARKRRMDSAPSPQRGRGATSRHGTAPVDLRLHVINMRFGELSTGGLHQTSASDVKGIVDAAKAWIGKDRGRRLAIYAHGGLVGEKLALDYARGTANWWMENDVYPIFCIWESDATTTILQLVRELLGGRKRGRDWLGDARDAAVESLVHFTGQPVWDTMKRNAARCSADGLQHGLTLLARRLKQGFGAGQPPIDLVGHSAGSIVLLPFLARMKAEGLSVSSFQMLAPAATTQLCADYLAHYDSRAMKTRIYAMQDETERRDTVANLYGKSLLYLVSRGFEDHFGEKISGLQKDLLSNRQLVALMCRWSEGVTREAMVFSPTPEGTPKRLRSAATTHGGFDNDAATMWSVMALIRGGDHADTITPFPATAVSDQRSGDEAGLRMELPEEVQTYLAIARSTGAGEAAAPVMAVPGTAGVSLPAEAHRGTKFALTVGIDDYAGAKRLAGCVNDSNAWKALLEARGFDVRQLIRAEETGKQQLITSLRDFVRRGGAGDTMVWHFSGHGMEVETGQGSEDDFEISGVDQAIVASNASEGLARQLEHALIDDDIHAILQGLHPEASCYIFLDSCFSGSASRFSLRGTPRSMGTLRRRDYAARTHSLTPPAAAARGGAYEGANHVLFSAASATQTAQEDGTPTRGVFSRAVEELLRTQTGALTNKEFPRRIQALLRDTSQTPDIFCDRARRDLPFPLSGA